MTSFSKENSFIARHPAMSALVSTAVLVASVGVGFMYSGLYDVSATSGHNAVTAWLLHKTYLQSLHRHAANIAAPSDLMTLDHVRAGARLYASTCAVCHGAPGQALSPIGQGILPLAPELLSPTRRNNPKMMFWVIKHGVKMTAMPAFGKTQSDQTIWNLTAFLCKGRGISPETFQQLSEDQKAVR